MEQKLEGKMSLDEMKKTWRKKKRWNISLNYEMKRLKCKKMWVCHMLLVYWQKRKNCVNKRWGNWSSIIFIGTFNNKPQDRLLIPKFVRRMKDSKHKIVHSQIFDKAANLWPMFKYASLKLSEMFPWILEISPESN